MSKRKRLKDSQLDDAYDILLNDLLRKKKEKVEFDSSEIESSSNDDSSSSDSNDSNDSDDSNVSNVSNVSNDSSNESFYDNVDSYSSISSDEEGEEDYDLTFDPFFQRFCSEPSSKDYDTWESNSNLPLSHSTSVLKFKINSTFDFNSLCNSSIDKENPTNTTKNFHFVKKRLLERWMEKYGEESMNEFRRMLFTGLNNYSDIFVPDILWSQRKIIRNLYCLHALNHVLKTRDRIIKGNKKVKKEGSVILDQSFSRPSILIVVPMRSDAYEVFIIIILLLLLFFLLFFYILLFFFFNFFFFLIFFYFFFILFFFFRSPALSFLFVLLAFLKLIINLNLKMNLVLMMLNLLIFLENQLTFKIDLVVILMICFVLVSPFKRNL